MSIQVNKMNFGDYTCDFLYNNNYFSLQNNKQIGKIVARESGLKIVKSSRVINPS